MNQKALTFQQIIACGRGSQRAIAKRLGVPESTVSKWKTGQRNPSTKMAFAIAEVTNSIPVLLKNGSFKFKRRGSK
jgi:transcriptional regulator with XRE-family HTH domain